MLFTEAEAGLGEALIGHLEASGVRPVAMRSPRATRMRWVTHLDVGPADVARAVEAVRAFPG
jgi:threonine aldolase